ncbi:MAG TPA: adenine phosphoribosyltransferase [Myxococcaceae bacterium]|nr:adenine phosphoribosyltransferase [Myxococcaceae bacterium]
MTDAIRARIRDIPDFPKKGINFKDITPLLADGPLFRSAIEGMLQPWRGEQIHKVVGIESRGFVFAAPMALAMGAGLILVRKPGKLPWKTVREEYALEYGSDTLELHEDALTGGERTLIVDDVLATGGTAAAVGRLVKRLGGDLVGYSFLSELTFLQGAQKLGDVQKHALLQY